MTATAFATQQKTTAQACAIILDQIQAATQFGLDTTAAMAHTGLDQAQALIQAPSMEAGQQVLASGLKQVQEQAQEFFRTGQALVAGQIQAAVKLGQLAKDNAEQVFQPQAKTKSR